MEPEYIERKDFLIGTEERTLHRREIEIIKELSNFNMTTKQVMLGKTPSIQYKWHTKNGNYVAEFKIWDWWDGKNISDLEISENYKGLGLSYQLLDYATKRLCGFDADGAEEKPCWDFCPNCGAKMDLEALQ